MAGDQRKGIGIMISFMVAFDVNRGIGLNGKLPWHISEDLQTFKRVTLNQHIVMGQTTYDFLPRKLKDRYITVVSIDPNYEAEGCEVVHDLKAFLEEHKDDETEYIICGGASIYRQSYPYARKAYISFVKDAYEVDTYFDAYNEEDWEVVNEIDYPEFTFKELIRKQ